MIWYYMWKNAYQNWMDWMSGDYEKDEPKAKLPSAIYIISGNTSHIQTSTDGETFEIDSDPYSAAQAYIERAIQDSTNLSHRNFCYRLGVADFIFADRKLVGIEAHDEHESRENVLEVIKNMKSILKLKSFW